MPSPPGQAFRLASHFVISDGVLVVRTTADSGPGSLRQAILDADTVTAGPVTIDFAIPGLGVQTIVPLSPLPPITTSMLVDGTTQPGYDGMPLIAFGGPQAGPSPLAVSSGDVTLRGLALARLAIDPTADEGLLAVVDAPGVTGQLSLLDAQGKVLVQNGGVSANNPASAIDENLAAGEYALAVEGSSGQGSYTWTTMLMPAAAPFQPISVGSNPVAIVAGDWNGDGQLDLAVANEDSNTVSILLGNGNGTFQPAVNYTVGEQPAGIVAGDWSGNGHLDLAVADYGSSAVSILLGNGDGTFEPAVEYNVGSGPEGIVAGDFTGDEHLDLAVTDLSSSAVSILLGNGDGTFQSSVNYPVGTNPFSIVAGDFAGDGHLDLAVADLGNEDLSSPGTDPGGVSVLMGNGDGTFQPARQYLAGTAPRAIVAGDFAGNGKLDLAVADWGAQIITEYGGTPGAGSVSVLLGNGDGMFRLAEQLAVPSQPTSIVAGDFTGDGHLDLAVADQTGLAVSVLLGNGDGTFQQAQQYSPGGGGNPEAIVAGDFDGDGRLDLAVAELDLYPAATGTVAILLGNGDGTFRSPVPNEVPAAEGVAAGDFTGDGHLDLAVVNGWTNNISILLGNGDGTFQPAVTYSAGIGPGAIVAADFNGDGRLDLAVTDFYSNEVSILLGNGDGTFQPAVEYPAGTGPGGIVAGNFTGDGHLDLAVGDSGSNSVAILPGNGDGTFQPPLESAAGPGLWGIVAGDFTGDGKLDLVVPEQDEIQLLLGNGNGTFQPPITVAAGLSGALVAGDFAGNGKLDLAVCNLLDSTISVLMGNGDGTFGPAVSYPVGIEPEFILAEDFTGDGKLDLAVVNAGSNDVSILQGNGDGTFRPAVTYPVGDQPADIVAGNFTGGSGVDLAVTNFVSGNVSVLKNNGGGTFTSAGLIATTSHATPLVADVDRDGTNDVLVVDGSGRYPLSPGNSRPARFVPPARHGEPRQSVPRHRLGARFLHRSHPGQRRRGRQRPLALRLSERRLRPGRLARHRFRPGADHRGRPQWQRLRRPGRPQCRRWDLDRLLRDKVRWSRQSGIRPRELPATRDTTGRTGRLQRPGDQHQRQRPARPGGHQRADRPGGRVVQRR